MKMVDVLFTLCFNKLIVNYSFVFHFLDVTAHNDSDFHLPVFTSFVNLASFFTSWL